MRQSPPIHFDTPWIEGNIAPALSISRQSNRLPCQVRPRSSIFADWKVDEVPVEAKFLQTAAAEVTACNGRVGLGVQIPNFVAMVA
jgi:hypothetical protein